MFVCWGVGPSHFLHAWACPLHPSGPEQREPCGALGLLLDIGGTAVSGLRSRCLVVMSMREHVLLPSGQLSY